MRSQATAYIPEKVLDPTHLRLELNMNMKDREVIPEIDQMGIIIATEIVEAGMAITIEEIIIRTINIAVGIEINPTGKGIDHPLRTINEIGETIETPISLPHPEGHQLIVINRHQDLTLETLNDHMNHQDIIAEATLGPLEKEEDHPDPSLETGIDQGTDDLEDAVNLVHTQEVVIDGTEGIDLLVETIIEDQVTTILMEIAEDTRLGQDHPPIHDIDHRLMGLPESPEMQGSLLLGRTAEGITMIAQVLPIVQDALVQIIYLQRVILHLPRNATNAIEIFQ